MADKQPEDTVQVEWEPTPNGDTKGDAIARQRNIRHVIECAKAMGISVSELEATASLYHQAKEIFIASSVREVVPVHTWDDKHFVAPGELTAILQEKLSGVIKDYVATHPKF
jgi:hypothetical protein